MAGGDDAEEEGEDEEEDELYQTRRLRSYPHVFPMAVTHTELPSSSATMDRSGMPFGCFLTPFIARADVYSRSVRCPESATVVPRCSTCKAYLNPFCELSSLQWTCSLCLSRNAVTRSMQRYRQADCKTLEEAQSILVDYPLPYRSLEGCPASIDGDLRVPCALRPLVHVLFIQESMPFESLRCLTDSLCQVLSEMHPDIRVVLVTFSHRLCVYSLDADADADKDRPAAHYCIPFVCAAAAATAAASGAKRSSTNSIKGSIKGRYQDMMPSASLAATLDFFEAARPVGQCLQAAQTALQQIHENFISDREEQHGYASVAIEEEEEEEEDEELRSHHVYLFAPPEVLLGPALEAVQQWVASPYRGGDRVRSGRGDGDGSGNADPDDDDDDDDDDDEKEGGSGNGFGSRLFGVLSSVARGFARDLLGEANTSSRPAARARDKPDLDFAGERVTHRELGKAAADHCSGVFIHLFVSGPQDLPEGAHDSVPANAARAPDTTAGSGKKKALEMTRPGLDRGWVQRLTSSFVERAVCVNVWGMCNFDSQRLGLAALAPLAQKTGGSLLKSSLGIHPAREQLHLTEQLRRAMSCMQLASRGVVRLRFSPVVEFGDEGVTGHMAEDTEYPGVYRIAGCSPTSTFAVHLAYKDGDANLSPADRNNKIVIQMAFSYDTLVEGEPRQGADTTSDTTAADATAAAAAAVESNQLEEIEAATDDYSDAAATILGIETEMSFLHAREAQERKRSMSTKPAIKSRRQAKEGILTSHAHAHAHSHATHGTSGHSSSNVSPASSTSTSSCVYDRSRSLVAVRKLRVLTVILQCTHRIPRLIQVASHTSIAVLLARLACARHSKLSLDGGKGTSGQAMLEAWAATLLSGNAMAAKATSESLPAALDQAISHGQLRRLLLMIYGAIHFLDLHAALNTSTAVALTSPSSLHHPAVNKHPSQLPTLSVSETDNWLVLHAFLATTDPYHSFKMLYPICQPVTDELCVVRQKILPLTREAMTMSSADAFLIDSGLDLVLYRNLPPRRPTQPLGASYSHLLQAPPRSQPAPPPAPAPAPPLAAAPPPAAASAPTHVPPVVLGLKALNILARHVDDRGGNREGSWDRTGGIMRKGDGSSDAAMRDDNGNYDDNGDGDGDDDDDSREAEEQHLHETSLENDDTDTSTIPAVPNLSAITSAMSDLATDPNWLPNTLTRRLATSSAVPRIHLSQAGQASASVLMSMLIEDADAQSRWLPSRHDRGQTQISSGYTSNTTTNWSSSDAFLLAVRAKALGVLKASGV